MAMRKIGIAFLRHPAVGSLLLLLIPGLSLKRWLALGAIGIAAVAIGIVFALKLSLGPGFHSFVGVLSLRDAPPTVRGGVFIAIGVVAAGAATAGLVASLAEVWLRKRHGRFLDSLYVERVLSGGPNVVAIGGGSGLPNLLRGLKHYTSNITAVVTVADDGGSSGRLRSELGILPPGDIRNCLVALADSEAVMQELMDYRFSTNGQLDGHSFGNMLIAALASIGGDFYKGVVAAGKLLAVRGSVVPSTFTDVTLVGSTVSGRRLIGESRIGTSEERLQSLALMPSDAPGHPDAVKAIKEAHLIVLGPGSLFTSIVPNLLVREISAAIADSSALKMYICNVAGEPGATVGYSIMDHLNVVRHYAGEAGVNVVIANSNVAHSDGSDGLNIIPPKAAWDDDTIYVSADVINEESPSRHDSAKLASAISEAYQRHRGKRRRLPRLRRSLQQSYLAAGGSGRLGAQ
jgi:uncharacterized cofD-like protein